MLYFGQKSLNFNFLYLIQTQPRLFLTLIQILVIAWLCEKWWACTFFTELLFSSRPFLTASQVNKFWNCWLTRGIPLDTPPPQWQYEGMIFAWWRLKQQVKVRNFSYQVTWRRWSILKRWGLTELEAKDFHTWTKLFRQPIHFLKVHHNYFANHFYVQSNLDYPDLDYPDFSIIRTFFWSRFFHEY